jgi:hypothetical protein
MPGATLNTEHARTSFPVFLCATQSTIGAWLTQDCGDLIKSQMEFWTFVVWFKSAGIPFFAIYSKNVCNFERL